jgi:ssRNA-specific RNase YbeY (16S rRNA maturation enzyme)
MKFVASHENYRRKNKQKDIWSLIFNEIDFFTVNLPIKGKILITLDRIVSTLR